MPPKKKRVVELLCEIDDELGYLATAEQASNRSLSMSLARRSSCAMAGPTPFPLANAWARRRAGWSLDHRGPAPPIEQRMATLRFRRADCPINRIVVTRPDGFITFAAIKWLHGVGVGFVQLDWDGTVLLASQPRGARFGVQWLAATAAAQYSRVYGAACVRWTAGKPG